MANSNTVNNKKKSSINNTINKEKKRNSKVGSNNVELTKKNLTQKEINKKKYENRQKTYRENRKKANKKGENVQTVVAIETPIKKQAKKSNEKVKTTKKEITVKKETNLKKNLKEFKSIGTDAYNTVKEKTSDKSIPLGKNKLDKKKRKRRYLKEALIFAIIITFINLLAYVLFDYVNLLRIFDIKIFNVLATLVTSLIIGFIFSFFIDYFISELWVTIKRKRTGDTYGNKELEQEKYQEDISIKKRK